MKNKISKFNYKSTFNASAISLVTYTIVRICPENRSDSKRGNYSTNKRKRPSAFQHYRLCISTGFFYHIALF